MYDVENGIIVEGEKAYFKVRGVKFDFKKYVTYMQDDNIINASEGKETIYDGVGIMYDNNTELLRGGNKYGIYIR